ncbi:nucleolar pre-ribosomal-associated protein 1 [Cryptococcus neoformans Tu259-1]|uniref:Nucleolar pre-ribosomal-associated protein 1 n=1 Tax=Cryptococcus neoformans Tu259-1 TaxID=1230072 RepID=A0A854QDR5_CRYNE|nr:nucleolar pre-ribosomal-associated protein 1 [Cryptococcus neoformans var. grubii Tu259-1]
MAPKRKWQEGQEDSLPTIVRAKPGTKAFASGKSVKDALATGSPQAFVSFRQQIVTPPSELPLSINHPTVVILQHYLDISPACDEIFRAWQVGEQTKSEQQVHAAVELLSEIIQVLTPVPFFRSIVIGLVNKVISPSEPYHDHINHLIQSGKRDDVYHGLLLAAVSMSVDSPSTSSTSGRLGMKLWNTLVEGGAVRGFGKQMGMRRRNKEGMVGYGDRDPLDKPDIRHLILRIILPLFPSPSFQPHAKTILPPLYSNLAADPPITVLRILTALWAAISSPSFGLNRRVSLILFQERSIEALWGQLGRDDVEEKSGKKVGELVRAFLEGITATPGKGVCFPDEGWYPRQMDDSKEGDNKVGNGGDTWRKGLHNRILGNVVRKVGNKVVDDEGIVGEWMIEVFRACPELVSGYWAHSALSLEPRLNARWMATMSYVGRIISLPVPPLQTFRQTAPAGTDPSLSPFRTEPPQASTIVESVLPAPFTKAHLMKGLQHAEGIVQHMTAITLSRALAKLGQVQELFSFIETELYPNGQPDNPWARRQRELEMEVRKRLPELAVIVAFAQKSAQLAPAEPDPDSEEDRALVTKSAMLTELALRIFSLCNRILPSMASELKFDVGRLLVSSSSAKQEKKEKQQAREGSVIGDDAQSVKSIGTVGSKGTIGMRGGFGQSRGEVEGFEALSQVHVLELLGEVRDWHWSNKAAGSQYTYVYHILLLHLSAPQSVTYSKTTALLSHLLLPTLLFEHDPQELPIWLGAMPKRVREAGPMLFAQQIQLLAFLDDCFRRCLKTPYRYIEDTLALSPSSTPDLQSNSKEMVSPLMMAILEQFSAKLMGQLVSTEAACIIVNYLRRVILGLVGKQRELSWLLAVLNRLEDIVKGVKEAGQERKGLEECVQVIKGDFDVIMGKSEPAKGQDPSLPQLLDHREWSSSSFEYQALFIARPSTLSSLLFLIQRKDASILFHVNFLIHLNILQPSSTSAIKNQDSTQAVLTLFAKSLDNVEGASEWQDQIKRNVFGDFGSRKLFLSEDSHEFRDSLNILIRHLIFGKPTDEEIAQGFVEHCVELLGNDKKGKKLDQNLRVLAPWVRFLTPSQATQISQILFRHKNPVLSSHAFLLSDIITLTKSPAFAVKHLDKLGELGVVEAVIKLVDDAAKDRKSSDELASLKINRETIQLLLRLASNESISLLVRLIQASSSAAKVTFSVLQEGEALVNDRRLLPVVEALFVLGLDFGKASTIASVALETITSEQDEKVQGAAIEVLVRLAESASNEIVEILFTVQLSSFNSAFMRFVERLAHICKTKIELLESICHLIGLGLQYAVRLCSNLKDMNGESAAALKSLEQSIEVVDQDQLDLQIALVEPVITAVIQDRLEIAEAADLATLLAARVELKASFLRQQLQAIYASATYTRCTTSSCPSHIRLHFIRLLHRLFASSTYVSCQPPFIEPLILLYRGTTSEVDRRVLHMLQLFEGYRRISIASIMRYWNANGVLGIGGKSLDALASLDPQKVFATCQAYPLRRQLRGWGKIATDPEEGEGLYDPVFVMGLFVASMHEGMRGLDWVEVLRSNVLGLTVCGLSSRDKEVRSVASYALAKTMSLIETTGFFERAQLTYTLRLLRHALPTSTSRLPILSTLFFAYALRSLANPSHFFYPLSSRFLLQRSVFDSEDTPLLYGMLYANGEGWKRERNWMVRFLKEGVRSEADWRVIRRRKVWSLMATLFIESLDPVFRRSILQTMSNILLIPAAASSLVLRDGLFVWLDMQWTSISAYHASLPVSSKSGVRGQRAQAWEQEEKNLLLEIAERACEAIASAEKERIKEGKDLRGWAKQTETFLKTVLSDADGEKLEVASKILYSVSQIPVDTTITQLLPLFVDRLSSAGSVAPALPNIISCLFAAGLNVKPADVREKDDLAKALAEVRWRVERGEAGNYLKDWVRREKQLSELMT